jgi:transposase InsO family protein
MVDGFAVDETLELQDCETCIHMKQTTKPFSTASQCLMTAAGELTHTDLWGPAHFAVTDGACYYMIFINDYSQHCTLRLLCEKSEATEMVKGYLAFIEWNLGLLPKAIQADNGGEYINNDLKSWLNQ